MSLMSVTHIAWGMSRHLFLFSNWIFLTKKLVTNVPLAVVSFSVDNFLALGELGCHAYESAVALKSYLEASKCSRE